MHKIFVILLLMVGVSNIEAKPMHFLRKGRAVASYQDPVAVQKAFTLLYHKYGVEADTIAMEISDFFYKDPKMQMALARSYYSNNDYVQTQRYIAKAVKADPKYIPAYILKGDLFGVGNIDSAIVYYDKAIAVDPKQPEAYIRYAQVMAFRSLNIAKLRLEDLRRARPDYPVDIEIAGLYNNKGDDDAAAKAWAKVDPNILSMNQLIQYGQNLYWAKEKDDARAMEIAQVGIRRFPQNHGFSRLYFWCATRLGEYQKAMEKGKVWFDNTRSDSINSIDLFSMGACCLGVISVKHNTKAQVDSAFYYFGQIPTKKDQFASQMESPIRRLMSQMVEERKKAKDYDGAVYMYQKFMAEYPSKTDPAYQLYTLAGIYRDKCLEETGDKKLETANKMFALYTEIEKKYPDWENIMFALYYHANYVYTILDPNNDQGLAMPYWKQLYQQVEKQKNPTEQQKNFAITAAQNLATYSYLKKHDLATARVWWRNILKFDPNNEQVKNYLETIKK